jgi:hypothetical protein
MQGNHWCGCLKTAASRHEVDLMVNARTRLKDAIRAYLANEEDHLDEFAREVLVRLASDPDAGNAFACLMLKDQRDERLILKTCVDADVLARSFSKRIQIVEETLVRMVELSEAVATLRTFVKELTPKRDEPPSNDPLSSKITDPPGALEAMQYGLSLISKRIDASRYAAEEDKLRFGATRNNGLAEPRSVAADPAETARQNSAIGWLAEGVRRITGKANLKPVTDLAQVILGITILTEDRVRSATRIRKREWRRP